MGATSTDLQNEPGNQICAVLLIEGFPYIITDHGDLDAVFVAWEESDWGEGSISGQLPGLKVHGQISQRFEPYADTIDAPRLTFVIQPDEDEILATAIFKTKPSFATRITDVFEPGSDGSGVMSVKQTTDAPSSGLLYSGGKTLMYSAKGGSSFTVTAGNAYSPYLGGIDRFTPGNAIDPGDFYTTSQPSKVQDVPRTWIGKRVALYLHRVRGGVLDRFDQAQLEFAGTIKTISENQSGETVLECEELRGVIRDTVLHKNQWTGFVREGIHLVTGVEFRAEQLRSTAITSQSNRLTVVSSGAAATYEINAGIYDIHEFIQLIDKWLHNDANLDGASNGWYAKVNDEMRFEVGAEFSTTAPTGIALFCNDPYVMEFLGYDPHQMERNREWYIARSTINSSHGSVVSPGAPFRVRALQHGNGKGKLDSGYTINLTGSQGEWFEHSAYLPSTMADWADGENYSVLEIGGEFFFGKYTSATQLTDVLGLVGGERGRGGVRDKLTGLTIEDPSEHFEVKQVITLAGSLQELIPKLLASVQGTGANHADHDVLPFGAGIPWSLLGTPFTDSLASLNDTDDQGGMVVRLEKPTKLLDILMPELAMRFAFIVWKDGGYSFVTPPTPNALNADHTLDETNKAGQPGQELRSTSHISQEWLRNVIKVEYNRGADGKYKDVAIIKKQASIDDYGESQPVTIRAANTFDDEVQSGASAQDAMARLDTILEFWAKPLKVVKRPIPPTLYHAAPGDTVALSDDFVRDPTSGTRGLTGRGGVILSSTHDWGSDGGRLFGEVEILISDEDRTYPFSPCADVDHTYTAGTFTAGYSSSTSQLKLKQHSYSRSTDAKDVTHWDAGDLIRIIQIDPADPTSITSWDRTIATAGVDADNDLITLTSALSSPAFNSALRYRVVPQLFTSVQASQKNHAFIADDSDGLILDAAQPNQFGEFSIDSYAEADLTTLPSLIPTVSDDEGRPLHPGLLYDFGTMGNNLINYGCAFSSPMIFDTSITETSTSYVCHLIFPVWCGGSFPPGKTRYIKCAPRMRTTASTAYCRVTSSRQPPRGSSLTGVKWYGPRNHKEFTTTSAVSGGAEATAADLRVIRGDLAGITWITVELKATSGQTTTLYGLSRFYLGPLEDL